SGRARPLRSAVRVTRQFTRDLIMRMRNLRSMVPKAVWPIYGVYLAMQVLDSTAGPVLLPFLRTLVICGNDANPID
ncbi:unnamed protein product, partial [Amoebophrya sp. A25]